MFLNSKIAIGVVSLNLLTFVCMPAAWASKDSSPGKPISAHSKQTYTHAGPNDTHEAAVPKEHTYTTFNSEKTVNKNNNSERVTNVTEVHEKNVYQNNGHNHDYHDHGDYHDHDYYHDHGYYEGRHGYYENGVFIETPLVEVGVPGQPVYVQPVPAPVYVQPVPAPVYVQPEPLINLDLNLGG